MYVQLRGDWGHSSFRRGVRDSKGALLKNLEFAPNSVVEVKDKAEIEAVADDIDKGTLRIVALKDGVFGPVEEAVEKKPSKKKAAAEE